MLAVYRQRSFTRAGLDLGLTQTAVSHQIAQLERWLGCTLFLRGRAGVELTPEAGTIVPKVTEAVEGLLRVLDEARSVEGVSVRPIRRSTSVSRSNTAVRSWMPKMSAWRSG